ncbi:MAG: zf-HC2 domain-containing protein [Acidimicrobiales bacterium]
MTLFRRRPDRPINCRQVGKRLQRYLDGDIDELTARRILHHLEDCRRCGLEAAAYAAIKASLARRGEVADDAVARLREFGERLLREGPPSEDESAGA